MKNFNFYQDVKMTVWERQYFTIEAENLEEAKEKAAEFADTDVSNSELEYSSEILLDTEELMTPEENNGNATIELYLDGEKTPFMTNYDGCLPEKPLQKSAHEVAEETMNGYTIEATEKTEGGVTYHAFHKDDKLIIIVLLADGGAKEYVFGMSWTELVNENDEFRETMAKELLERDKRNMPFVHDWLAGHLTEMKVNNNYVDNKVPFDLLDVVEVGEHLAVIKEFQPVGQVGYQVVGDGNELPEGYWSFQIIRDKDKAMTVLAYARYHNPEKNFQLVPIYQGDIEKPTFI